MSFALSILLALPSFAGDFSVVGELVREDHMVPGQHAEGTLVLRSHSDSPQSLRVYRRDYVAHVDGTDAYLDAGTTPRSSAAWVSVTAGEVVLPPHGTQRLRYRVDVPLGPAIGGTYWSVLVIEPPVSSAPAGTSPLEAAVAPGSVTQQTTVHYGVQLVTHVGAPDGALLAFDHGALVPHPEPDPAAAPTAKAERARHGGSMSLDIRNAGPYLLAPRVWVELFDADGQKAGRFAARGRRGILPGCSARYAIDIGGVAPGAYTALAVADAGGAAVFGAEYPVELR